MRLLGTSEIAPGQYQSCEVSRKSLQYGAYGFYRQIGLHLGVGASDDLFRKTQLMLRQLFRGVQSTAFTFNQPVEIHRSHPVSVERSLTLHHEAPN